MGVSPVQKFRIIGEVQTSPFVFMTRLFDLKNDHGDYFRLSILGYQFPDDRIDFFDANWLVARVDGAQQGRTWQIEDACVLTYEIPAVADWLRGLLDGAKAP